MARIKESTIERVKEVARIDEVIQDNSVTLTSQRGSSELVGLCPFHDDKHPSFNVNPHKGVYVCRSCGVGGNVIKFLMAKGSTFPDAIIYLAERYGIPVEFEDGSEDKEYLLQKDTKKNLMDAMEAATRFYEECLWSDEGKFVREYLQNRGFTEEAIKKARFGYAPRGRTRLAYTMDKWKFQPTVMEQAGLGVFYTDEETGGQLLRDVFVYRLIIPIFNRTGQVVAFGGRALDDERQKPKYRNSPETLIYSKRNVLYGLERAATEIKKANRAIIVEGYFDQKALEAQGIGFVVASCGVALTPQQVSQVLASMDENNVYLGFDNDGAGIAATQKAIEGVKHLAYQGQVNLKVLNYSPFKDAADFISAKGVDAFRQMLKEATNWIEWTLRQYLKDKDLDDPEVLREAIQMVSDMVSHIPDPTVRTVYLRDLSEILAQGDISMAKQLTESLRSQIKGTQWQSQVVKIPQEQMGMREQAEHELMTIYLHSPYHRKLLEESMAAAELEFKSPVCKTLWAKIQTLDKTSSKLLDSLQTKLLQDEAQEAPDMAFLWSPDEKSQVALDNPPEAIEGAIKRLQLLMAKQRLERLVSNLTGSKGNPQLAQELTQKIRRERAFIAQLQKRKK